MYLVAGFHEKERWWIVGLSDHIFALARKESFRARVNVLLDEFAHDIH